MSTDTYPNFMANFWVSRLGCATWLPSCVKGICSSSTCRRAPRVVLAIGSEEPKKLERKENRVDEAWGVSLARGKPPRVGCQISSFPLDRSQLAPPTATPGDYMRFSQG